MTESDQAPSADLYGLLAEFVGADEVLGAARRAHAAGFRRMDAYTPIPVHGLAHALGKKPTKLPLVTLAGALLGALIAYGMQYYAAVVVYPMNVGGRPYHSWAAFLPITFELTVLGGALFAVLGMLGLNGLPMPYHPVFNVPQFERASRNRFFLCIEARDPQFSLAQTRAFLEGLGAQAVYEVEP